LLKTKAETIFNNIFLVLLFLLIVGTPLVFTTMTRAVFEVNKLLLLRIVTILVCSTWFFKYILFRANGFSLRFKKTGLEWPLLFLIIANLLSTVFSQNLRLSLLGSYDRWEGIYTVLNYLLLILIYSKLTTRKYQFFWLVGGILFSTGLSAFYGVFQSLGLDSLFNWSMDPERRVFACINNPVHFCAYVAMVVPLGLGAILYVRKNIYLKWLIFFITALIYYSQFLSYSRAAWLGFGVAMTLFYLLVTHSFNFKSKHNLMLDFFLTSLGMAAFYLFYIFNFHQISYLMSALIFGGITGYLVFSFFWQKSEIKKVFLKINLILLFATLQFITSSWIYLGFYIVLLVGFYYLGIKDNQALEKVNKSWLMLFPIVFAVIILVPTLPARLSSSGLKAMGNVTVKVDSYKTVAIEGTARTSMWKSAVPWVKDYWLLGSGLDTVKYMYPDYRRPEYGILEGGHNYTPDRLHNEYLNTLATKGVLGFVIYYFVVVLGWYILMLSGYFDLQKEPRRFFLAAFISGVTVYLGQVLFNFGVVATLVLFYIFMGLGIAVRNLKET
jgi:putative inorganic carbon (hco3(-)) transporter